MEYAAGLLLVVDGVFRRILREELSGGELHPLAILHFRLPPPQQVIEIVQRLGLQVVRQRPGLFLNGFGGAHRSVALMAGV